MAFSPVGIWLSFLVMSADYRQLLGATIAHLERLRERGASFVSVSPEALESLNPSGQRTGVKAKGAASNPVPEPGPSPKYGAVGAPAPSGANSKPGEDWRLKAASTVGSSSIPASASVPPPAVPLASRPALGAAEKAAAFADLRQRTLACVKCPNLVRARQSVVFGVGNPDAELMFVGEAPGADEDRQGEPFVGAAGQLLTKIIQAMGCQREEVYIANILKCRPDTPGQTAGNRKPTPAEMATCIPWLHEQIDLVRPRVLVALGATAVEGLLGGPVFIMKLRGNWREYRGIPLMPTYHPAFLLRNQSLIEKRKLWEDMLKVMETLGRPISEKQRNYFLRA